MRDISAGEVEILYWSHRLHWYYTRKTLYRKIYKITSALLETIIEHVNEEADIIAEKFESMESRIRQRPKDEAELANLVKYMEDSKHTVKVLTQMETLHNRLDILSAFAFRNSYENFEENWKIGMWPLKIQMAIQESDAEIAREEKEHMMNTLEKERVLPLKKN